TGMGKPQHLRVQGLAIEMIEQVPHEGLSPARCRAVSDGPSAVRLVAEDGMPDVLRVHTDLVGSSGFEAKCAHARVGHRLDELVIRHGPFSGSGRTHSHLLPVAGIASEIRLDAPRVRVRYAPYHGHVTSRDAALVELAREGGVRRIVLRHAEEPGCVLVETMDEARPNGPVFRVAGYGAYHRKPDVFVVQHFLVL